MIRNLYFVLYNGAAYRCAPFETSTGTTLRTAVSVNAAAYNVRQDKGEPQFETDPEEFLLFSWHLKSLPLSARVAQVPRPGVVLGVHRETLGRVRAAGQNMGVVLFQLRQELETGEEVADRFASYLQTPAARWPPVPLTEYDVLLSYQAEEAAVAAELEKELKKVELSCMAAQRPGISQTTEAEAWRQALASSALLLSVIGPSSVEAASVLREAGAAWALGRAIVPALVGVEPARLHYLMSSYQVRTIETALDRSTLAAELSDFMGDVAGGMTG